MSNLRADVVDTDYSPTDEQIRAHPFGRGTHAIQAPETLALGQRLTAARRAVNAGVATEDQRLLLTDTDAAMSRAAATRR